MKFIGGLQVFQLLEAKKYVILVRPSLNPWMLVLVTIGVQTSWPYFPLYW